MLNAVTTGNAFSSVGSILVLGRILCAALMVVGGILCLYFGYRVLTSPQQKTGRGLDSEIRIWGGFFRNRSAGATTMVTAFLWAWASVVALPDSVQETTNKDGDSSLKITAEVLSPLRGVASAQVLAGGNRYECSPVPSATPTTVCRELKAGEKCGPAPKLIDGLGRLQVAHVPSLNPAPTAESLDKGDARLTQLEMILRKTLKERGAGEWSSRLMRYRGVENSKVLPRLVFNNVAPETEEAMCAWLKCEEWTFGCRMVRVDTELEVSAP